MRESIGSLKSLLYISQDKKRGESTFKVPDTFTEKRGENRTASVERDRFRKKAAT